MDNPTITVDASACDSADERRPFDERFPNSSSQSPKGYALRVKRFAERAANADIHSGAIFRALAVFLNKPYTEKRKSATVGIFESTTSFLVRAQSTREDGKLGPILYRTIADVGEFLRNPPSQAAKAAHLVWLSGFPAPEWLNAIGAQYRIDPEFFRRYLIQDRDNYNITAMPSSTQRMVTLRLTTICRRQIALPRSSIEKARQEAVNCVQRHHKSLRPGDSIIRKYNVFDNTIFTLEQDIGIYVERSKHHNGWATVICSDFGADLTKGPLGPWNDTSHSGVFPICEPVNLHLPKLALGPLPPPSTNHAPTTNTSLMAQNASLLAQHFDLGSNNEAFGLDIRETLHDLFAFAVAAEGQFLTMMEGLIERELRFQSTEARTEWTLTNLRAFKSSVDEHIVHLENILVFLRRPEIPRWTPPARSPSPESRGSGSRDSRSRCVTASRGLPEKSQSFRLSALGDDYAYILEHARRLSLRSVENTTTLVNMAMLEESRKAIIQADGLRRLTLLAFFFLPLSLATSFFGMNFSELGKGDMSIWVFFAFAVPLVTICTVLCFWDSIKRRYQKRLMWSKRISGSKHTGGASC